MGVGEHRRGPKKEIVVAALTSWCAVSLAHETDQYSVPIGREFADLRFFYSEYVYDVLESAAERTNARIRASLRDGQPTATTVNLQSAKTIASAVFIGFPPVINHVDTLEMTLRNPSVQRRFSGLIVSYHAPAWIYHHPVLVIDPTKLVRLLRCGTVMLDGTYLGTDKLVHFVHMGYIYFGAYNGAIERGESEEAAIRRALDIGAGNHPLSEAGVLGGLTTGVFSNADLAADYCGLKFYRNLTEPVRLRGEMQPPLLVREGEFWRLNDHVRRGSDFFSVFVSPHWDEALNPSVYGPGMSPPIRVEVKKRCADVLHWYRDESGRPLSRADFEAIALELTTYYGEDYARKGDLSELVTVANVCFDDPASPEPTEAAGARRPASVGLANFTEDASGRDVLGRSRVWRAASSGRLSEIRASSGGAVSAADFDGETPLHAAARAGHGKVVEALLDSGADPTAQAIYGQTALHLAARAGHPEVVRVLLRRGAESGARDSFGCTALHDAAGQGHGEVVRALLEAGADVNVVDRNGTTPLHCGARGGHADVVRQLLAAGANPQPANLAGRTALDEAKFSRNRAVIDLLRHRGNRERTSSRR